MHLLAHLAFPVVVLAAAFAVVFFGDALSAALDWFQAYGPYAMFGIGAALAAASNRGCALFPLVTLAAAYAAQQLWLQAGLTTPLARAVYVALTMLVPFYLALFAALPERGIFNRHGALRLAVVAVPAALAAALIASGQTAAFAWAARKFVDPAPFGIGSIPQAGIAAIVLGLLVAAVAAWFRRSAVSAACAGAIAAFTVAAHVPAASLTFSIFIASAQLMLAIAVLQDRLASRARAAPKRSGAGAR